MSQLGIRWKIDGVPAAFNTRGADNRRYSVTFERSEATLEQIERINWAAPTLERVTESLAEPGLPEGYGFQLMELRYQHTSQNFIAEVQTARQYWGDVTAYQTQIEALNETIAQQQTTVDAQADQLRSMVTDMEAAYEEGVESHG